jgi:hypothetical protein
LIILVACRKVRPLKSWRSAWRSLRTAVDLEGLRMHDTRHSAVPTMAGENKNTGVRPAILRFLTVVGRAWALWQATQSARREDNSALNPRHRWFFVNRVRQQQNGSAEKQCVEEKVQRNHVCRRGQEHRQEIHSTVRRIVSPKDVAAVPAFLFTSKQAPARIKRDRVALSS